MKTNTKMEISITLTVEEAIWLKCLVQNAQCDPATESANSSLMRAALFGALPSFEELHRANVPADTLKIDHEYTIKL